MVVVVVVVVAAVVVIVIGHRCSYIEDATMVQHMPPQQRHQGHNPNGTWDRDRRDRGPGGGLWGSGMGIARTEVPAGGGRGDV